MSQSSHSSKRPGSVAWPQASHTVHSKQRQPLLSTTLVICQQNRHIFRSILKYKKCFGCEKKEKVTMNCYLNANTKWMVALATLSAGQETALRTKAKAPTHHTHVLGKNTSSVSPFGLSCGFEGTCFLSRWSINIFSTSSYYLLC